MSLLKKYNIEPIENHLILKREVISETTESGLYTGEAAAGISNIAEVLACGPGLLDVNGGRLPMQAKVGDKVIIDQYSGQSIVIEGENLLIARESACVATIRPK